MGLSRFQILNPGISGLKTSKNVILWERFTSLNISKIVKKFRIANFHTILAYNVNIRHHSGLIDFTTDQKCLKMTKNWLKFGQKWQFSIPKSQLIPNPGIGIWNESRDPGIGFRDCKPYIWCHLYRTIVKSNFNICRYMFYNIMIQVKL